MTVPVIASISQRYPEHEFVVVAKKRLQDMFYGMGNVRFHEADLPLPEEHYDAVINLNDNWWTLLQKQWRTWRFSHGALEHETARIATIFRQYGLESGDDFTALKVNPEAQKRIEERYGKRPKEMRWIGIAPFAKKRSNMLPYRITKEVIAHYSNLSNTRVFLFGAGKIECEMLRQWAGIYPGVESVAGQLTLGEELELMRTLDVMICMDSANQHLSSLIGLRAVSIWCATHPQLGFYGWKQNPKDSISVQGLRCRPCTVHGRGHCPFRNFACQQIEAGDVVKKVNWEL